MSNVVCTFPGKIGDLLWALPTLYALAVRHVEPVDLVTSTYCAPLIRLLEEQVFINSVQIPNDYRITGWSPGVQPWKMPVTGDYSKVYHLGYKTQPSCRLMYFIAEQVGVDPIIPQLRYPGFIAPQDFILVAMSHYSPQILAAIGNKLAADYPVVWVGEDCPESNGVNLTPLDFWHTAGLMASAKLIISAVSSNAVLARLMKRPLLCINVPETQNSIFAIDNCAVVNVPNGAVDPELIADSVAARVRGSLTADGTVQVSSDTALWASSVREQFGV